MANQSVLKFKISKKFGGIIYPSKKINIRQHLILQKLKKGGKKRSNFSLQLQARQLLSHLYGKINTKYLIKLFQKSLKFHGKVGSNFLSFLERRLDTILYKLHFTPTFASARQLITHKKIMVNNQIITKAAYILKPGDIISIEPDFKEQTAKNIKNFFKFQETIGTLRRKQKTNKTTKVSLNKIFWHKTPHVEVNYKILQIIYLFSPQQAYYPIAIDLDLITKAFQR
jgi:small subunit ribosomal protein S4